MSLLIVAEDEDRRTGLVETLVKQFNIPAARGKIPVDYTWVANGRVWMGDNKTPADLIASANDGRLMNQVESMKQAGAQGFILVEGLKTDGFMVDRWTFDQFYNLLLSIQMEGVWIDASPSEKLTPRRLAALFTWTQKGKHGSWKNPIAALPPAQDYLDADYQWKVGMLMHLGGKKGGCGPTLAERLMNSFGLMGSLGITEEGLADARKKWLSVHGVGKKLADKWERWIRDGQA